MICAEAVDSGMHTLVMEVSSQAYLRNRVYGLHYDVGVFLNISDHIGRNEHPTFENYLHCKLQLLVNSEVCVINAETDHFEEIYQANTGNHGSRKIYLYKNQLLNLRKKFRLILLFIMTAMIYK